MPIDITEYQSMAQDVRGQLLPAPLDVGALNQQLAVGASAVQSAALGSTTNFVRLHADVNCRFAIGPNPAAAATSPRLAMGATEYFGVRPGDKVSVITSS